MKRWVLAMLALAVGGGLAVGLGVGIAVGQGGATAPGPALQSDIADSELVMYCYQVREEFTP
jgi:hypothetical protein